MDELRSRLAEAVELAEGYTVFAHRQDVVEWMIAGFRDSSGMELSPSQACRMYVASFCMMSAASNRTLAVGDAKFLQNFLGEFFEPVRDQEGASELAAQFGSQLKQLSTQREFLREAALYARASRDAESHRLLTLGFDTVAAEFKQRWRDTELNLPLVSPGGADSISGNKPSWPPLVPDSELEVSAYRPGSLLDRMTRGLNRFASRMDERTRRLEEFNSKLESQRKKR